MLIRILVAAVVALAGLARGAEPAGQPKSADVIFAEDFEQFDKSRWSNINGPKTNRCWFDDIVLSRSYIGPAEPTKQTKD